MRIQRAFVPILFILVVITLATSCVASRKYEDTKARAELYQDSTRMLKAQMKMAEKEITALHEEIEEVHEELSSIQKDTAELRRRYRMVQALNDNLNELYEKVIAQNKELLANTTTEKEKYLTDLYAKEGELERKTHELEAKETMLAEKEEALKAQQQKMADLEENLEARSKRVNELENALAKRDSALTQLKNDIAEALIGFKNDELTVEERDGRIYVSMTNKLLFQSGSTVVDPKGKEALGKLATAMEDTEDVMIIVEGHTDDVPISSGSSMKDNWDLSVLRATAITRILVANGLNNERVMPSGRGEYMPRASNETSEGRALNRRTEIIISPNYSKVLDALK